MAEQTWPSAYKIMRDNYSLSADAIGVFALNLRFNLDDIESIASEAMTGGGDDKKCDVIYVDKELQLAVVAQCYVSSTAKQAAPANKASDLNTAVAWLLSQPIDTLPDGLRGRADELRSAIRAGEIKQLFIWYVHNLPGSKNVRDELSAVEASTKSAIRQIAVNSGINVFAQEICKIELEKLYTQAERTVIVTDEILTTVPDALEVEGSDWTSVATVVTGKWLSDLYRKYQTDLFSANLRGYLGSRESDSNINNGIKTSATEEPGNFYVYNNGITALVLDYELGPRRKSGRKFRINGMSIVNGAQTTGSLGSLIVELPDDLKVSIRFVKAKKESIVSNVVRFNNLQNKLQAADFRSTDGIQDRLRLEFQNIPNAEYEGGRRGGASDAIKRSKFTLPSYSVGQALAAYHGDPVSAYDKKSELWTNEKSYRQIFTERTSARHVIFCYSLLSEINKKRITLRRSQKEGGIKSSEEKHLAFLNKKGANFLLVHVISQAMETILGQAVPNKADLRFRTNVSPESAGQSWIPLIDLILALSNQLDDAFSRERISNETITKSVPNFVGVIDSLAEIQKPTFEAFSKKVEIAT